MAQQLTKSDVQKERFYYGYVIVFVSVIIMMLTFGVLYSFGIFFTPLLAEFGWTKAQTSAAYSISTVVSGFLGIFAGRLTDRFSAKVVAIGGGSFLGIGCILMSQVNALWQVYLIYGIVLAAGIGGCWPSLTATVPRWFLARRGLMTGIVVSGVGLNQVIIPPLVSRLITAYGWRISYIILGTFTWVLIVAAAMFMKRDPYQRGQLMYGEEKAPAAADKLQITKMLSVREMIRSRYFWLLCAIYFFFGYGLHTINVHIVTFAIEGGIGPETAATIIIAIGATSIISKLLVGASSSRIGVKNSLIYCLIIWIIGFLWLQFAGDLWTLYVFGVLFGFAYGGTMAMQSLLAAELFGLSSLGLIIGSVCFIYTIGSAVGPAMSGYIFDITTSYRMAFYICALLGLAALAVVLMVPGRGAKR